MTEENSRAPQRPMGTRRHQGSSFQEDTLRAATLCAGCYLGLKAAQSICGWLCGLLGRSPARDKHVPLHVGTEAPGPGEDRWQPLGQNPPADPAEAREVAQKELPMTVREFYEFFLASDAPHLKQYHLKTGQYELNWTPWHLRDDSSTEWGTFVRTVSFVQPAKAPNPRPTRCVSNQQLGMYRGDTLTVRMVQNMLDIPYKDSFCVITSWRVQPSSSHPHHCVVTIKVEVPFSKWCMMKGLIEKTTMRDCKQFYEGLFAYALTLSQNGQLLQPLPKSRAHALEPTSAPTGLDQTLTACRPVSMTHIYLLEGMMVLVLLLQLYSLSSQGLLDLSPLWQLVSWTKHPSDLVAE